MADCCSLVSILLIMACRGLPDPVSTQTSAVCAKHDYYFASSMVLYYYPKILQRFRFYLLICFPCYSPCVVLLSKNLQYVIMKNVGGAVAC